MYTASKLLITTNPNSVKAKMSFITDILTESIFVVLNNYANTQQFPNTTKVIYQNSFIPYYSE